MHCDWRKEVDENLKRLQSLLFGADQFMEKSDFSSVQILGLRLLDLLYKDYQGDQKFTITIYSSTVVAITTNGRNKGDVFVSDLATQVKNKNFTADIKVATDSSVITSDCLSFTKNMAKKKKPHVYIYVSTDGDPAETLVFEKKELLMSIKDHVFVPEHQVLTREEK